MKRFYEAKLIDLNMDGDWNEIEELYQYPAKPKVLAVPTLPEAYRQLNDGEYIDNYVEYESHPIIKKKYDQMIKEALERNDDEYDEFFDDEDDEDYFYRPTQPLISTKIDRNSKINVRYTDGKLVNNVKYKKVEDDIAAGKCLIV
jgi:preprotein translocase subunit SecA